MTLKEAGPIPLSSDVLAGIFPQLHAHNQKVRALERSGDLIRLKRGLYVTNPRLTGEPLSMELISNHIYGPSYVSRETALRHYGLIPEYVPLVRAVTTKHTRSFTNALGTFEYTGVPHDYFAVGITFERVRNHAFLIATPEKALCDLIVLRAQLNLRYRKDICTFLFDDLRLDEDAFFALRPEVFRDVAACGRKVRTLEQIAILLERNRS